MSKGAKALTAAVALLLWGIATLADPADSKPPKKTSAGEKPTTRVGTPTLPPLKPTTEPGTDLTPEQEVKLLAALKESSPDHYYAYLIALKKGGDQALYRRALGYFWRTYREWRDAPKYVRDAVLAER